jgi:hypothetical protein
LSFSIFSATSFGGALVPYCVQSFCVSSWSRRSRPACPRALNEALSTSAALALVWASSGLVAQPATQAAAAASVPYATIRLIMAGLIA